ncbi:cytochrome P450 4C1-like [Cataglyphis hispanica]|uniref:cytochrome P450 4C1-like n=1 Tax=Cataglyphis hispanica TaxID=1086592 RepID=UPI00217FF25D|nr:cytochrome P450 4C1-like [Cataglyphis hispanica]
MAEMLQRLSMLCHLKRYTAETQHEEHLNGLTPDQPGTGVRISKTFASYVVPAGTILYLDIFQVHRDPNFWPNPEVFDPDRFLPKNIQNRHPFSYLPFSAGSRNCIGQRFSLLEMKAMIASLVHNFYLEPINYLKDIQLKFDIIIRPCHPVYIKFIPISRK